MKKTRKLCCVLLAVAMMLTQIIAVSADGEFSDVPANSAFAEAVYTLADFGVILGDAGSNTFRPEANISREEFSVIMTRILGLGALNITVTEYPFLDVTPETCDDWSIKATKIAYDLGIISGYGDGNFGPKDNVTYEQAVKMLVCALGYEQAAITAGGWPNGYISVARDKGILKRAEAPQSQPATRQIIAQLVYNSLDVDLMVSFSTNEGQGSSQVVPGQNLLNQKLKYTKGTGVVTGNNMSALGSLSKGIKEDEVQIDFELKFKVGETNAADLLGKTVTYYYATDDVDKTLVAVRETNNNTVYELDAKAVRAISGSALTYYPDIDDQTVYETYDLDTGNVYGLYNGKYATVNASIKPDTGNVKLIDNDGDGLVEVVIVNSVSAFVVSAVDATNYKLFDKYDQSNELILDPTTKDTIIITKNGSNVDFSAIAKGNVLLVAQSMNPSGAKTIEVQIVTNIITGVVDGISADGEQVKIGDKTYECTQQYLNYVKTATSERISLGDKVTLYLNNNNEIVAADATTATTYKYGYLVAAGENTRKEVAEFKIFTQSKTTTTLTGAEKVRVNGTAYTYDDVCDALKNNISMTNKDLDALVPTDDQDNDGDTDYTASEIAAFKSKAEYSQLIKYTTNSLGYIDSIVTMTSSGDIERNLVQSAGYTTGTYSTTNHTLGSSVTINANTKIFFVPTDRSVSKDYSVRNISNLKNNKSYAFEAYDNSETGVAAVVVVYGGTQLTELEAPVVILDSVKQVTVAGVATTQITCLENGKLVTYNCDGISNIFAPYQRGDVLKLMLDGQGKVSSVKVAMDFDSIPAVNTVGNKTNGDDEDEVRYYTAGEDEGTAGAEYLTIYGTVYARDDDRMTVSLYDVDSNSELDGSTLYPIPFSSNTTFYVLDTTVDATSNNRLVKGSYSNIAGYASAKTGASRIFAYCKEGVTQFVVILKK